jgi:hypothetical protein
MRVSGHGFVHSLTEGRDTRWRSLGPSVDGLPPDLPNFSALKQKTRYPRSTNGPASARQWFRGDRMPVTFAKKANLSNDAPAKVRAHERQSRHAGQERKGRDGAKYPAHSSGIRGVGHRDEKTAQERDERQHVPPAAQSYDPLAPRLSSRTSAG